MAGADSAMQCRCLGEIVEGLIIPLPPGLRLPGGSGQ